MTIQTKITASAIRLTLFFFLSATSVWALAGSAIMANQVAPVVSVTVNASESVAGPRQYYTQVERIWQESLAMCSGRFDETGRLLKRAIYILEADAEIDRTDVTTAQHNLAGFYVHQQRLIQADTLFRKTLAKWKAAPAQQRLQITASLNELGNEYLAQHRLEEARLQFELVIELLEDDFGRDHPYVRSAMAALEKLKSEQAKLGERKGFDQRMF